MTLPMTEGGESSSRDHAHTAGSALDGGLYDRLSALAEALSKRLTVPVDAPSVVRDAARFVLAHSSAKPSERESSRDEKLSIALRALGDAINDAKVQRELKALALRERDAAREALRTLLDAMILCRDEIQIDDWIDFASSALQPDAKGEG